MTLPFITLDEPSVMTLTDFIILGWLFGSGGAVCEVVGCGSGKDGFFTKVTYPNAPANTTTKTMRIIFTNPFWFICLIITKLIIDFDFMIKKFSSPKIKIWFEPTPIPSAFSGATGQVFFSGLFCGFRLLERGDNFKFFFGGILFQLYKLRFNTQNLPVIFFCALASV